VPARRNGVLEAAPKRAAAYVNFAALRTPGEGDRSGFIGKKLSEKKR
jgi:hypothetical protein